jgi:hypothetical protein
MKHIPYILLNTYSSLKPLVAGAVAFAAVLGIQNAQAVTIDFTIAEGYSPSAGLLNGQPTDSPEWLAHDAWRVNGTSGIAFANRGYASNNVTAKYQRALASSVGTAVSVSTKLQFAGIGDSADVTSTKFIYTLMLATSSAAESTSPNFVKAILARQGGTDNYQFYLVSDANPYAGAKFFNINAIGDDGTPGDLTANLQMTMSMTKGASATDWDIEVTLVNLDNSTTVATISLSDYATSTDFYTSNSLYGGFYAGNSAVNGGTTELNISEFSASPTIPEPASSGLIGAAVLLLAAAMVRRRIRR